jgi:anti-sigma regulatory factor (Ser/Thr protein kinase)
VESEIRVATRALGPGCAAVEAALRKAELPDDVVLELLLAAEEVLTNVAAYAHDDGAEHWVRVTLGRTGDEVTLRFEDDGRPFDPLAAPPPDLASPVEERPAGGLGIHLVRSLVDGAEYARVGGGNVLTLRRRVTPPAGGVT